MLTAVEDEVHIWLCHSDTVECDDAYNGSLRALLDADELARMQRFRFPRHAHQFLLSHSFTRHVLSQYAPIAPGEWRFQKNEWGKPFVVNENLQWLQFSLSHTAGLIAVAVTREHPLGCDVERRNPERRRGPDIAERFFAPAETAELLGFDEPEQALRFFDYWSLKESFIKAEGKGLAIALDSFAFSLASRPLMFSCDDSAAESRWDFSLLDVGAAHSAAIAAPSGCRGLLGWRGEPLRDAARFEPILR